MTASVSSNVNHGISLETVLTDRGPFAVPDGVNLVRQVASQLAELHAVGQFAGIISTSSVFLDEQQSAAVLVPGTGATVSLDDAEIEQLCPELSGPAAYDLPREISPARERLAAAGVTLDPREIDIC